MNFTATEILKKLAGLVAITFVIALVMRLSMSEHFMWWWITLIVFGFVLIFIEPGKLTMKHAIGVWVILIAIWLVPVFFPGSYDGITGRIAILDFMFGNTVRADSNETAAAMKAMQCRNLASDSETELAAKLATIWKSKDSFAEKSAKSADAQKEHSTNLEEMNRVYCGNSTALPTPTPSDSAPKTSTAGENTTTVTVNADTPWTDTGIDVTGKTVTIKRVSGCWDNGGAKPTNQCGEGLGLYPGTIISSAAIGSLIAKTDAGNHQIGASGTVSNSRGKLKLGMNEVPGKNGDNNGALVVEITAQ